MSLIYLFSCFRDTYVKIETGESPNDRNDRGMFLLILQGSIDFGLCKINMLR